MPESAPTKPPDNSTRIAEDEDPLATLPEEEAEEDDPYADAEPDAARVAQWVDEEELDNVSDESESEGDEEADGEVALETEARGRGALVRA